MRIHLLQGGGEGIHQDVRLQLRPTVSDYMYNICIFFTKNNHVIFRGNVIGGSMYEQNNFNDVHSCDGDKGYRDSQEYSGLCSKHTIFNNFDFR